MPEKIESGPQMSEPEEAEGWRKPLILAENSPDAYRRWRKNNSGKNDYEFDKELREKDRQLFFGWAQKIARELLNGTEPTVSQEEIELLTDAFVRRNPSFSEEEMELFYEAFPDIKRKVAAKKIVSGRWPGAKPII